MMFAPTNREEYAKMVAETEYLRERVRELEAHISWMQTYHEAGIQALIKRAKSESSIYEPIARYPEYTLSELQAMGLDPAATESADDDTTT